MLFCIYRILIGIAKQPLYTYRYLYIYMYTSRFYTFCIYRIPDGADFASRLFTTATIYIYNKCFYVF